MACAGINILLSHCAVNDLTEKPRVDVGGKLLTNHLSNLVSFRQWNMLDQTYIVNDIKEKCCYVTLSFKDDLEKDR